MRHTADDGIQHRPQIAVVTQVGCTLTSGLHDDGQRQRLRVGIGFQPQQLRNAIVGENEVVGGEREDNLAGLGLHQRRHEHQVRAHGEGRDLRAGRGWFTTLRTGRHSRE